jgi:hypothetical protein
MANSEMISLLSRMNEEKYGTLLFGATDLQWD